MALAKIGGLLALMRIGFFLQMIHRKQFESSLFQGIESSDSNNPSNGGDPHIGLIQETNASSVNEQKDDFNDFSFEAFRQMKFENERLRRQ